MAGVDDALASMAIKAYREKYCTVTKLWKDVEEAAKNAIRNPEKRFECCCTGEKVLWGIDAKKEFLVCRLPSGRHLRYYKPFLKTITKKWGGEGEEIHFMGEDSTTHQWSEQKTYGGKLVENITQAVARDIMAKGMLNCERGGFPVILTVHDELVAEVEKRRANLELFLDLMCDLSPWAAGCPITAEGWVGERYRK